MSPALFAVLAIGVAVGALAFYVGMGVVKSRESSGQRLAGLQTRSDVLESGFSERAVAPILEGVGKFAIRFTPQGWVEGAQKKLMLAGWADRMDGNTWAAIRIISLVVSIVLALFLQSLIDDTLFRFIAFGVILFIGFFGPSAMLNRSIDARRKDMEKKLPDMIDLLVISVEAGLGFEAAMGRVVQNVPGELSREFSRTLQETRVGVSRNVALRGLAERTDVDDLNTFIMALIQADQFGVSIARMLRVQSDEMRVRRRTRAQERAFAAPVKLVFPLVFFIFPAIFVILLGPAVMKISAVLGDVL
jgi:tight adherence protein C